ncbi:ribonuclease HII [Candidatus Dependentiae bacterium]|nr:ribonuclease HII [Candidatus Dependentiae bacterium]
MAKEKINLQLYKYEKELWAQNQVACGIDEVGRGCLAGPVVAAAAILYPHRYHPKLKDSKLLKPEVRTEVYNWLMLHSIYAVAINSARTIDQKNIYKTTQLTMKQALLHLLEKTFSTPSLILVDAVPLIIHNTPYHAIKQESLIKGESKSASIAAASIIAKVIRDRILQRIDHSFPHYHLKQHKGYATKDHQEALKKLKPSIIHRQTFLKKFNFQENFYEQKSIFD